MFRVVVGIVALFGAAWSTTAGAQEHPMLKRGVSQYEAADFEAALSTFDAAAHNADLSVEDLLQLFEMRALVHHALGEQPAMRRDLRRLAAVRPSYQLGALAPPQVQNAFDQVLAKAPKVELRIEAKTANRKTSMLAHVVHAPHGLVDHVTLTCLVGADAIAISHTSQGTETEVPLPDRRAQARCDATARTRQGGVLFRAILGEARPSLQPTHGIFLAPQYVSVSDTATIKKKKRWPWFVAAAAVVVAGGVTAGVVLSKRSSDSETTLGGATVNW